MADEAHLRIALGLILVLGFGGSGAIRRRADVEGGRVERRRDGPLVKSLLVGAGLLTWGAVLAYLVRPRWIAWSRTPVPDALQWVGIALVGAAVAGALWALYHLGRNVTPTAEVRPDATLVESGPYRWVRHPLYTAGIPLLVGAALVTGSALVLAGGIVGMAVIAVRTRREEANLVAHFGDRYRQYMERTGRYWPRVHLRRP